MGVEEIRTLLQAYVALTLAHDAAEQYAGAAAPHPHLTTVIKSHGLAIRELEGLLEKALSGVQDSPDLHGADECAEMLM